MLPNKPLWEALAKVVLVEDVHGGGVVVRGGGVVVGAHVGAEVDTGLSSAGSYSSAGSKHSIMGFEMGAYAPTKAFTAPWLYFV